MDKEHHYSATIYWQSEQGTTGYKNYSRDHLINIPGKPVLEASSDPAFQGNPSKYNPEELFISAIANCHMLWYLHLCSINGIVVTDYRDSVKGVMQEEADGSGRFTAVMLFPIVTVKEPSMIEKAGQLHQEANKFCFIANSLNFAVHHQPKVIVKENYV